MKPNIHAEIWQLEQVLVLLTIGIIDSIKRGGMSFGEAREILFQPKTLWTLMRPDIQDVIQPEILDLVRQTIELEDTHLFWPDHLPESLDNIHQIAYTCLKNRREASLSPEFWLHCITGSEMTPNFDDDAE